MIKKIIKNDLFWLGLILLLGAFLRLYKLQAWQFFSYDQARDYLIIKKLILNHKFTLVGPTVLAPGIFLPPFYYYSLILPLWIFNFHLIGPDFYTAILGVIAIGVFYFLVKDFFGPKMAVLLSLIFSLNPYLIQASRHAWNPNTIYLFTTLFALAVERWLLLKKKFYLIIASFSLSWALNLHYTVVVFLPILFFLYFKELKDNPRSRYLWKSLGVFIFFVFPLGFFELRHNFPNIKGFFNFISKQSNAGTSAGFFIWERIKIVFIDCVKLPLTLLSGLNQNQNLSINPSHIVLFNETKITSDVKTSIGLVLVFIILIAVMNAFKNNRKNLKIIFVFFLSGLMVRLIIPPASFYFYHYTFLFPFVFLFLGFMLESIYKKSKASAILLAIFVAVFPFYASSLKNEVKNEKYFLDSAKIISQDAGKNSIAISCNLSDLSRWDHNGLEYRYFLESVYKLPLGNWDIADYKMADVLYLIDEGNLSEPLTLGGMEMEAFNPGKIEKDWQVDTGQKIYKMTK